LKCNTKVISSEVVLLTLSSIALAEWKKKDFCVVTSKLSIS